MKNELEKYLAVFPRYGWDLEYIGTHILLTLQTKPKVVFSVGTELNANVDFEFYTEDGDISETVMGLTATTPKELHTILTEWNVSNIPSHEEREEPPLHLAVLILNRGQDFEMMTLEVIINSLPDVSAYYYTEADQVSDQIDFAKRSGFHLILSAGDYHLQQNKCVLRSAVDDKAAARTVRLADLPRILADYQDDPALLLSKRNRTTAHKEDSAQIDHDES